MADSANGTVRQDAWGPSHQRMRVRFYRTNKYSAVADMLAGCTGTLLDVGSRDRVLKSYVSPALTYRSADVEPGHDYAFDLESPQPCPDREFDYVVALDVLEHVEATHVAFSELMRICSRKLIVALPNLASWTHRWHFATRGSLGTDKYDLQPDHQGDRHRWLTTVPQTDRFITTNAARHGFELMCALYEVEGRRRPSRMLAIAALDAGLPVRTLLTTRSIYVLCRPESESMTS
jgi:hypothetical protein